MTVLKLVYIYSETQDLTCRRSPDTTGRQKREANSCMKAVFPVPVVPDMMYTFFFFLLGLVRIWGSEVRGSVERDVVPLGDRE